MWCVLSSIFLGLWHAKNMDAYNAAAIGNVFSSNAHKRFLKILVTFYVLTFFIPFSTFFTSVLLCNEEKSRRTIEETSVTLGAGEAAVSASWLPMIWLTSLSWLSTIRAPVKLILLAGVDAPGDADTSFRFAFDLSRAVARRHRVRPVSKGRIMASLDTESNVSPTLSPDTIASPAYKRQAGGKLCTVKPTLGPHKKPILGVHLHDPLGAMSSAPDIAEAADNDSVSATGLRFIITRIINVSKGRYNHNAGHTGNESFTVSAATMPSIITRIDL